MKGLHEHVLDVYDVHLHHPTTRKAWTYLADLGMVDGDVPDDAGRTATARWAPTSPRELGEFHVIVWIDTKGHRDEPPALLVNTIAHEASHAADGILAYIEDDAPSTEQRAYLVGWLAAWIWGNLQ